MIPIIYGATGTGKSEILLRASDRISMEIISMDSVQIYKEMSVGTAKPSLSEQEQLRHHIIDIIYPDQPYNAYEYRKDSLSCIEGIVSRGSIPVFAGGTGLYLDSLIFGIFDGYPQNENIRRELRKREERDPGSLRKMLFDQDQESFNRIHPNDIKRTVRALEVIIQSGKKMSEAMSERKGDNRFKIIILERNREEMYERINKRALNMIENGLTEEVIKLLEKYDPSLLSFKAIGYKETIEYLKGKIPSLKDYLHILRLNTRHFSRRQIIWSRRYKDAARFEISNSEKRTNEFCDLINSIWNSKQEL